MSGALETDGTLDAALDETARLLLAAGPEPVALVCHVNPDGDALGSTLALHHLCRANGVPSVCGWSEPFVVAPHYAYLPGLDLATKPADFPAESRLLLTFDCGSFARLGDLEPNARWAAEHGTLAVVDHHATNDRFGTLNVIDTGAAATAVLVRRLAGRLGWALTRDAAECLYTGLVTDTGRFQYSSTTPEVFALAEELAAFGLPIAEITRQLFECHRFAYLRLAGVALARARLDPEARFVAAWVTQEDLLANDVTVDEVEGLIDLVRRTSEAEVSCVAKETPDQGFRVSLRSVTHQGPGGVEWGVDVGAIAAGFGGGGHRYAAGFNADGPVEELVEAIRVAVARAGVATAPPATR